MSPESARSLAKARQCLANARAALGIGLTEDAGRNAYLAAFHSAQAFIFARTKRIAKTHSGVRSEFARLARDEPRLRDQFSGFLARAYVLKEIADYETSPDAKIPEARCTEAVATAARFADEIAALIGEGA